MDFTKDDLELLAAGLLGGKPNLGQNLSQGLLLMRQGRTEREDRMRRQQQQAMQQQLAQLQLKQAQRADQEQQQISSVMGQYARPAQAQQTQPFQADTFPGEAPIQGLQTITQQARPASFDFQGASSALMGLGTPAAFKEGLQLSQMMQKQQPKFADINPKDFTAESVRKFQQSGNYGDLIHADANKPTGLAKLIAERDKYQPGTATYKFYNDKIAKETTHQPATTVNVDTAAKPFATDLGKGAADILNQSFANAQSANAALANVQAIRQAVDSGKIIMGPGASSQVVLEQLGQRLGVSGANSAERLANTRIAMQSLARQELAAAGQMKGQGQITESERAILRKAESGNIDDFTPAEIRVYLNAIEKTARYRIGVHQQNMQRAQGMPGVKDVLQFYQLPNVPDAAPSAAPAAPQSNGWSVTKVN